MANIRDSHLYFFQMVTEWQGFTVVTKLITHFKNLYGFGGRCLNITNICMDFEPCLKVYKFVSVYPKNIKLGQMTTLNVIFHVAVSIYRLVNIWNSPQFPARFRNGQFSNIYTNKVWYLQLPSKQDLIFVI